MMVRVGPHKSSTVENFCVSYKRFLVEAEEKNYKLNILFDLRLATLSGLHHASERLKLFFGTEIHDLSEKNVSEVTVVVPNAVIKKGIELIFNLFPGSIPTRFTYTIGKKNS